MRSVLGLWEIVSIVVVVLVLVIVWDEMGVVADRGRLLGVLVVPAGGIVDARSRPRLKVKRWRMRSAFWESLRSIMVDELRRGGGCC